MHFTRSQHLATMHSEAPATSISRSIRRNDCGFIRLRSAPRYFFNLQRSYFPANLSVIYENALIDITLGRKRVVGIVYCLEK